MEAQFLSGFGNHFSTEAVAGALPVGRNSPQRPAFGLYAEQISGSAFTMTRAENRRSWLYRIRPSAAHKPFGLVPGPGGETVGDALFAPASPNRLRWNPRTDREGDFLESLRPVLVTRDGGGITFSTYAASRDMGKRALASADGEYLILPVDGAIYITTEMGRMRIEPLQMAVIPRGLRFCVDLPDGSAMGYCIENGGAPFRLPDLGPIGANGLANPRDFLTPVAWFEDSDEPWQWVQKMDGRYWSTMLDHSPFDVVAWHGNYAPYLYDLRHFNTIGTVSFDHPDPSIFTVLTSPSAVPGQAHADFVIFPPRWMVAEDSFRPPWFHRNLMSEAMGVIHGTYDAKADGFAPGAVSLHNRMGAHGPDVTSWRAASDADLQPHKIEATMAFMVETHGIYHVTPWAETRSQDNYDAVWQGFPKAKIAR